MTRPVPALEATDLSHWYVDRRTGDRVASLNGMDLTVEAGEVVAIVGPSGCGKTTLLRIFGGLIEASSGSVLFDGEPITGPSPERGMVFQQPSILPWRTVFRNIAHGLEIQRVPRARRRARVTELIEMMGLQGFEEAYPHQLSGGMRQRVEVARVWANDPRIILMDEPFAAADDITRRRLQEELHRLSLAQQKTVVLVTHSVDEAVFLGDRVIVLSARPGRVLADVSVEPDRADRNRAAVNEEPRLRAAISEVDRLVRAQDRTECVQVAGDCSRDSDRS